MKHTNLKILIQTENGDDESVSGSGDNVVLFGGIQQDINNKVVWTVTNNEHSQQAASVKPTCA